ncbi:MAG TPA: hypothetical protein VMB20_02790 [Candidatus Acidoferrum sp.]|nr:hypothetical protein [Candidatus Acidoferrum sp.]
MASIAQYLLHLAADPKALDVHNKSEESADAQMRKHGLNDEQRAAIKTKKQKNITDALAKELPPAAARGFARIFDYNDGIYIGGGGHGPGH